MQECRHKTATNTDQLVEYKNDIQEATFASVFSAQFFFAHLARRIVSFGLQGITNWKPAEQVWQFTANLIRRRRRRRSQQHGFASVTVAWHSDICVDCLRTSAYSKGTRFNGVSILRWDRHAYLLVGALRDALWKDLSSVQLWLSPARSTATILCHFRRVRKIAKSDY